MLLLFVLSATYIELLLQRPFPLSFVLRQHPLLPLLQWLAIELVPPVLVVTKLVVVVVVVVVVAEWKNDWVVLWKKWKWWKWWM